MSYISAPNDHQSTALPCPLRVNISGALSSVDTKLQFILEINSVDYYYYYLRSLATLIIIVNRIEYSSVGSVYK